MSDALVFDVGLSDVRCEVSGVDLSGVEVSGLQELAGAAGYQLGAAEGCDRQLSDAVVSCQEAAAENLSAVLEKK